MKIQKVVLGMLFIGGMCFVNDVKADNPVKKEAKVVKSSCTTAGLTFVGNGKTATSCTETLSDGSKKQTIATCTQSGTQMGGVQATQTECTYEYIETPAKSKEKKK